MSATAGLFAVAGHPIDHSLSPLIHAAFARQTGASIEYLKLDLAPDDFAAGVRRFAARGGRGLNVTLPHKRAAYEYSAAVSCAARVAGAVNTLTLLDEHTWCGDITDGEGLVRDLTLHLDIDVAGQRVLLLGAGGSARACLGPLLALKPAALRVANRTAETATELARRFERFGCVRGGGLDEAAAGRFDLVINATATSLAGTTPDVDARAVRDARCYDLMYAAGGTEFTRWAQANGARSVHTGIGMLVEQAAASWLIWHGAEPETAPVRRQLAREHGLTI